MVLRVLLMREGQHMVAQCLPASRCRSAARARSMRRSEEPRSPSRSPAARNSTWRCIRRRGRERAPVYGSKHPAAGGGCHGGELACPTNLRVG